MPGDKIDSGNSYAVFLFFSFLLSLFLFLYRGRLFPANNSYIFPRTFHRGVFFRSYCSKSAKEFRWHEPGSTSQYEYVDFTPLPRVRLRDNLESLPQTGATLCIYVACQQGYRPPFEHEILIRKSNRPEHIFAGSVFPTPGIDIGQRPWLLLVHSFTWNWNFPRHAHVKRICSIQGSWFSTCNACALNIMRLGHIVYWYHIVL